MFCERLHYKLLRRYRSIFYRVPRIFFFFFKRLVAPLSQCFVHLIYGYLNFELHNIFTTSRLTRFVPLLSAHLRGTRKNFNRGGTFATVRLMDLLIFVYTRISDNRVMHRTPGPEQMQSASICKCQNYQRGKNVAYS